VLHFEAHLYRFIVEAHLYRFIFEAHLYRFIFEAHLYRFIVEAHLYRIIVEAHLPLNTKYSMTYGIGNLGPCLGQAQNVAGLNR
jgi:hypothetical protein